jgi:Mce-associated membrane protein
MSLDFNKAQENVQQIIDNSTGQFKTDFENQADDFVKVAQESKVVTDVTVNATAVEKMSPDTAVVLVAATSRVTNAAGAKQEPRAWRLSVNLKREGGQIKMEKVEFVP